MLVALNETGSVAHRFFRRLRFLGFLSPVAFALSPIFLLSQVLPTHHEVPARENDTDEQNRQGGNCTGQHAGLYVNGSRVQAIYVIL